jgi:predicted transcriptional regulator
LLVDVLPSNQVYITFMQDTSLALLDLTAKIVSGYVANNNLPAGELGALIRSTHAALLRLSSQPEAVEAAPLIPAVPIRRSVTPDAIICLEDGKSFKSLKRHLTKLGITPEQYRAKWGLPSDYPMVAPNYAEARSALAKSIGLGRKMGGGRAAPKASRAPARTR